MKLNDEVYRDVAATFNVPWQVVRQIMESSVRLIRKEITSPDHWGCITLPGIGKFDTKKRYKKDYPSNKEKITDNMKQYGRKPGKRVKKT